MDTETFHFDQAAIKAGHTEDLWNIVRTGTDPRARREA